MSIRVGDLDISVSTEVKNLMTQELYYQLKTLPLAHETEKFQRVIQGEFKEKLDSVVVDYYKVFSEHDVDVDITSDDYINLYLGKAI